MIARSLLFLSILLLPAFLSAQPVEDYSKQVKIHRDSWGVPHIDGPTDAAVAYGFAYAQAEDFFWQIEDTAIMGLGRSAEFNGENGLDNDLVNRAFEIPRRSKEDYEKSEPQFRKIGEAFAAGLNHYLEKHPNTPRRLTEKFEPWHFSAMERNSLLTHTYGRLHTGRGDLRKNLEEWRKHAGSNGWAIAPSRTASGNAMLFINPHQPYYGYGQFGEAHLRSGEGLNVSGCFLFGSPLIIIGRNEYLGWANTTNDPGMASAWVETFDDSQNPLNYKYDGAYRTATEWTEIVKIKKGNNIEERTYTFRKTHHGPIIAKRDDTHYISGRVANLFEGNRMRQLFAMAKSKNLDDFKRAHKDSDFPLFNMTYADREGNIFYLYGAAVPTRDPSFDWNQPVDGSDPRTEWGPIHRMEDLPQVENPPSGFVQNCNSTPFTTTDVGSPSWQDYPPYMVEEKHDDKRRARVSRMILREQRGLTYEKLQELAFDTTMYWPLAELPNYRRRFEVIKKENPELAQKAAPYLEHLLNWDCVNTADCTQSVLCADWYFLMYEGMYPAEELKREYMLSWEKRFEALIEAATALEKKFGTWKPKWGDVHRHQRHENVSDFLKLPFSDKKESVPSVGVNGPLGVVFTVYYMPPFIGRTKRYALVGSSFMGVYEFGKDKVKSKTLLQYGQNGHADSPHFFDQAELFSEKMFKDAWFDWEDVVAHTVKAYHPGEE